MLSSSTSICSSLVPMGKSKVSCSVKKSPKVLLPTACGAVSQSSFTWADTALCRLQAGSTARQAWETTTRDLNSLLRALLVRCEFGFHKPAIRAWGYKWLSSTEERHCLMGQPSWLSLCLKHTACYSLWYSARLTRTGSHLTYKVCRGKWNYCFLSLQCL